MEVSLFQTAACIAIGFLTCWGLIPAIRRVALRRGRDARSVELHHTHKALVPRFGGVALVAAFALVALAVAVMIPTGLTPTRTRWTIVLGAVGMFGLGFCDDLRKLGAKVKLLGQIAIAVAVYFGGVQIEVLKNPLTNTSYALGALGFCATVFWLVALTNLVNLIDGIDGLAAGIGFMLMCLLANVGLDAGFSFSTMLAVGVAGALLGFLYYNYPPARIYMGDGGAYFLGFLIAEMSIVNSHKGSVAAALIAPVFALALPILDVSLAILRRGLKGLPVFRPDRKHIHHRLLDLGLSRERAVLVLYAISVCCLFVAFGVFWLQGRLLPLLCGCLFLVFLVAARAFGFVKDWTPFSTRADKSLSWRRETRYALTLSQWLEMEAERRECVFELWQDYQFVAKKLGFSEVRLRLADGVQVWRSAGGEAGLGDLHRTRQELGGGSFLEFAAYDSVLPARLFELLSDLAAETWQKSARRWQEVHEAPLRFDAVSSDTSVFRKMPRRYEPVRQAWWIPKREEARVRAA
jgi:UDP-GlcNAc:undecaprenyl-phosphate/decaprenyl-phosphate GlcNAc-1-phosphate transferase